MLAFTSVSYSGSAWSHGKNGLWESWETLLLQDATSMSMSIYVPSWLAFLGKSRWPPFVKGSPLKKTPAQAQGS